MTTRRYPAVNLNSIPNIQSESAWPTSDMARADTRTATQATEDRQRSGRQHAESNLQTLRAFSRSIRDTVDQHLATIGLNLGSVYMRREEMSDHVVIYDFNHQEVGRIALVDGDSGYIAAPRATQNASVGEQVRRELALRAMARFDTRSHQPSSLFDGMFEPLQPATTESVMWPRLPDPWTVASSAYLTGSLDATDYTVNETQRRNLIKAGWTPPTPTQERRDYERRVIEHTARMTGDHQAVRDFMTQGRAEGKVWEDILVELLTKTLAEKADLQAKLRNKEHTGAMWGSIRQGAAWPGF
jgi:hypothetical protein